MREGHLSIHHAVEHGLAIGIDGVSETAKPWTPKPSGRHVNMAWCLEAGMHIAWAAGLLIIQERLA